MKYYIIAGEASGDLHGANLMKGLLQHDPSCSIRFWGGGKMAAVGGTLVKDYRDNAVMGLVEVLGRLGSILRNLTFCKEDILQFSPDAVILIDYPGFNLKIARFAHSHGIKVFYYIPPKVWARGESRIRLLRKYVDKVFIIFPFEVEYFRSKGLDVIYNGNPLVDNINDTPSIHMGREEWLRSHSLSEDGRPVIAFLAGSRKMEVDYLMPRIIRTAAVLTEKTGGRFRYMLAAAPSIDLEYYRRYTEDSDIEIIQGDTYGVLSHSEAAVISSGTASLEAAVIGTPQVVCYGMNPITYALARLIVRLDTISLANMILGKHIFKELLQGDCTPGNIADEVLRMTDDADYRRRMIQDYDDMRAMLGERDSAARTAADIERLIQEK
ncbi:MAG TPA: lipid-A-disaccharide synthase [Candidatus Coprenecus stercoravium]|uniref:Lipid-A-disaccharide synthase n=1 Tax=Candidatus Coprenecus stercoravium TaxID=2840735 RepID=A0A9D2K900_9BACT|nr:lipid-A-disaccharide synthase [Candidatus Coprenecus stercoravium]